LHRPVPATCPDWYGCGSILRDRYTRGHHAGRPQFYTCARGCHQRVRRPQPDKGVASAVSCFAQNSAFADAAATLVANAATCIHPAVEQCPAEQIDPLTDIRGHRVTRRIGALSAEAIGQAMHGGIQCARQLHAHKTIAAAVIYINNQVGIWPPQFARFLRASQSGC